MISIFKNFVKVIDHKTITEILTEIRIGKYKQTILNLRKALAENKMDLYEKTKKSLPAFTPSGNFVGGRKMDFLSIYSNLIILDIDKLTSKKLKNTRLLLSQNEFTYAYFVSPSGNGLKILVKVNSSIERHRQTFLEVQKYYENLLELSIDKSGKDITRLCFYSYDEDLYYNQTSKVYACENIQQTSSDNHIKIEKYRSPILSSELSYNQIVKF